MLANLRFHGFCVIATVFVSVNLGRGADDSSPVGRPAYLDPDQPLEVRVEDLLSKMTLAEKMALIHADSKFTTPAIPRLGIPRRWLSDGPNGVREDIGPDNWAPAGATDDFVTAMPAEICLAATWNPELALNEGEAIGQEARARHKDIMLGPGVNIMRTPLCGRNFEYFGEDPFLTSRMAVGFIRGEQSQDVSSCVKHFALNNQEQNRGTVNVQVDERALREIYMTAFKAAVQEAGVWSVMGAYNQFRGQHCCENEYLLHKILKDEWRFKGLVMSDWAGVHDTRKAALNGLDLEMGTDRNYSDFFLADPYLKGLQSGEFPMVGLDEKVRRNLRVMFATHVFDPDRKTGSLNTAAHQAVARRIAEEGIVLLKNENGALPLNLKSVKSIAIIGDNAVRLQANEGGSSQVKAFYEITPLQGILKRASKHVNLTFSQGYAKNGGPDLAERAIAAAKAADAVIFVGGLNHDAGFDCEDADRKNLELPYGQNKLIEQIVAANPRTIVVLEGTVIETGRWLDQVPAVVEAWYPGMEGGDALAGVLFGDVNPSGRLPCTFPKRLEDTPAAAFGVGAYPGTNGTVDYAEGLLVGYRWYDAKKIEPRFPFGFGLSYSTFEYSHLKLISGNGTNFTVTVQFEIKNTGKIAGMEVAQLYVHQCHARVLRPENELKGFEKVFLEPGQTKTISIELNSSAFAYFDPVQTNWVADTDDFKLSVGKSSRDLCLSGGFHLTTPASR